MIQLKKNIDLNLLVCLDALLTEGSVTRAADRLNMSQPGMSHALSRLRMLTGDALFVRTGNDFIQTDRARALAQKVRSGLATLEEIFSAEGPFDPSSTAGRLTVAAVDSVGVMLLPRLAQVLATDAPMVTMHARLPDADKVREWLSEGECDIAIGYFPESIPDLHSTDLYGQTLSCISGPQHPRFELPMELEHYLDSTHVVLGSPFSGRSPMETTIDEALASASKERNRSVQVSSMLMVPYLVSSSPHVGALPTPLARHCARFLQLSVQPLPVKVPQVVIRMLWHDRTQRVGLHRWIRQLVRVIAHALAESDGALALHSDAEPLIDV